VKKNLCKVLHGTYMCESRETNQDSDWSMQRDCEHYAANDKFYCTCFYWISRYKCTSEDARRDVRLITEMEKL